MNLIQFSSIPKIATMRHQLSKYGLQTNISCKSTFTIFSYYIIIRIEREI